MAVAALLDMGFDLKFLKSELRKLGLGKLDIRIKRVKCGDISSTRFYLKEPQKNTNFRTRKYIFSLLERSRLKDEVKTLAREIFSNLFKAESRVHNEHIDKIRLNELADIDSIVDIVSVAVLVRELKADRVYSSRVSLGRGFVKTRDGVLPLPAPAALELLKDVPVSILEETCELVTPTGASILKTLVDSYDNVPEFKVERIGYGAASGKRQDGIPNMLRLVFGQTPAKPLYDEVFMVEVNLDDILPFNLEYVLDKLLKEGALDVFISPIIMKKSRPANLLSVIVEEGLLDRIVNIIFEETPTFGIRYFKVKRRKLEKKTIPISTPYGRVNVKIGILGGKIKTVSPEYEDCKKLATSLNIPLRKIYEVAKKTFTPKI